MPGAGLGTSPPACPRSAPAEATARSPAAAHACAGGSGAALPHGPVPPPTQSASRLAGPGRSRRHAEGECARGSAGGARGQVANVPASVRARGSRSRPQPHRGRERLAGEPGGKSELGRGGVSPGRGPSLGGVGAPVGQPGGRQGAAWPLPA